MHRVFAGVGEVKEGELKPVPSRWLPGEAIAQTGKRALLNTAAR